MSLLVSGTLVDPAGKPIPKADIVLTSVSTSFVVLSGFSTRQPTDDSAAYSFLLEPGNYAISVSKDGANFYYGAITITNTTVPSSLNQLLKQNIMEAEISPEYVPYFQQIQKEVNDSEARSKANADAAGQSAVELKQTVKEFASDELANNAIATGFIANGELFSIRVGDNSYWSLEYQNQGGVAIPTGQWVPNGAAIQTLEQSQFDMKLAMIQMQRLMSYMRQYTSSQYHWSVEGAGGPSETAIALDNDFGLWLAGLPAAVQEYLEYIIPKSLANRYQGLQYAIVAKNGRDGLLTINDNGDIRLVGMDDILQDRLDAICSTTFSRRVVGFQFVIFTSDMKTAIFAIDDDGGVHIPGVKGALQDNLGESLAKVAPLNGVPAAWWGDKAVWSERPVRTAQKLTEKAMVLSYKPGGEAVAGDGVMYVPSVREMPIDASEIHGGGSAGQSLNTPFDGNGANIVNRNPLYRGRILAGANGRPEGGGLNPVTETDLTNLNDMWYPAYRQGNVLPMYNKLLDANPGNQVFIHAPFAAGGRSFAQISKGTIPYQNGIDFVRFAKAVADGVGKPYVFKFLTLEHGETDNDNGDNPNPGDYLEKMNHYFAGLQIDFKGITAQAENFTVVIGQVGSRINSKSQPVDEQGNPIGSPVIVQPYSVAATDQLTYVRQNPATAIMYGPKYPLNWKHSDGSLSHLNAVGKVLQGVYAAQATYWQLYDPVKKGTWTDTRVRSISLDGEILDLVYDLPYPPVVIDTTSIIDCPGRGYSLEKKSAEVLAVEVVAQNKLRITFDKVPAADDYLLIGFTNTTPHANGSVYPLVCVRDSSPITETIKNVVYPIYNWASLERLPLTGAF
jgi:hypothetical protein